MLYKKIKVSCKDCPERFYRVMFVRKDLNLQQLGFVILNSLRCEWEHAYLFEDAENSYVPRDWMDEECEEDDRDMTAYTVDDLHLNSGNTFTLEYDTGECWDFLIKVYKEEKEINDEFFGTNTEAKGDRIWEDARYEFIRFLEGKEPGTLPWNLPEESEAKDFDNKIDLQGLNNETEIYEETYEEYMSAE